MAGDGKGGGGGPGGPKVDVVFRQKKSDKSASGSKEPSIFDDEGEEEAPYVPVGTSKGRGTAKAGRKTPPIASSRVAVPPAPKGSRPKYARQTAKQLLRTDMQLDFAKRAVGQTKLDFFLIAREEVIKELNKLVNLHIEKREESHDGRAWTKAMSETIKDALTIRGSAPGSGKIKVSIDARSDRTALFLERGYRERSMWDIMKTSTRLKTSEKTGQKYMIIPFYWFDPKFNKTEAGREWVSIMRTGIRKFNANNPLRRPGRKTFQPIHLPVDPTASKAITSKTMSTLMLKLHSADEGALIYKGGTVLPGTLGPVSRRNLYRNRHEYVSPLGSQGPVVPGYKTGRRAGHAVSFAVLTEERMRQIKIPGLKGLHLMRMVKKAKRSLVNKAAARAKRRYLALHRGQPDEE